VKIKETILSKTILKVTAGIFTFEDVQNMSPKNDKWTFSLFEEKTGETIKFLPEMSDSVCMENQDKQGMISLDPLKHKQYN